MKYYYSKEETIQELCKLITEIGGYFNHQYSSDCICGENPCGTRVDYHIVNFIQEAVKEKLKYSNNKEIEEKKNNGR